MQNREFTKEELNLIKRYSVKQTLLESLLFYICVLVAPTGFALYGTLNKDPVAMLVAFLGLLAFVIWFVFSSLKYEKMLNNICMKILEKELPK